MNKKIIYSILILLSFCFIDNVSALGEEIEPYFDFDSYGTNPSIWTQFPDKAEITENLQSNYDVIYQYYLDNCANIYDSYIITNNSYNGYGYTDNVYLLCFNQNTNEYTPNISVHAGTYSGNSKYAYLYYYLNIYKSANSTRDYQLVRVSNNQNVYTNLELDNYQWRMKIYHYVNVASIQYKDNTILSTNIFFPFSSDAEKADTKPLASFKMNGTIYNEGDFGYNEGILYDKSKDIAPTITIKKESETSVTILDQEYITDVTLNIEFSIVDNNKYLYMYKYGDTSDWTTITLNNSNNFNITYGENGTLYVQILDTNTLEYITSATFTITRINYNNTPYITVQEKDNVNCTYNDSRLCKILEVNTHINDLDKYSFWYKEPGQDIFYKFDSYSVSSDNRIINFDVYDNGIFYFRIIDNETNNIIDEIDYNVTSIDLSIDEISLNIKLKKESFYRVQSTMNLKLFFDIINIPLDNYDIYLRRNDSEFSLINNLIENNNIYISTFETSVTEDTALYFKITDKSNNFVTNITFDINYSKKYEEWLQDNGNEDINAIQNFVNDHIFSKLKFVSQLKTIYESIFLYDIIEGTDAPSFTFDLSFIHLEPVTVDMEIDYKIRSQIHGYIKLFATLSVLFIFIKKLSTFWADNK